jgi:hypothetical protein
LARTERRRASGGEQAQRDPVDVGALARRLLEDQPASAPSARDVLELAGLTRAPTAARYDDDLPDWIAPDQYEYYDDEDLAVATGLSGHDLLALAAERGTEVIVFAAAGRNGTEVISDERGRKKPILLESIISVMECP